MKTLETPRLILRDWQESDIGCQVFDEKNIRYLMSVQNNYAIVLKATGEVIGTIGLNEDAGDDPNTRNVGVRLLEPYHNQGLMSEALQEVIRNAHDIADALSWFCRVKDVRSQHIAEKFGFAYVKTFYNVKDLGDFYYYILKV